MRALAALWLPLSLFAFRREESIPSSSLRSPMHPLSDPTCRQLVGQAEISAQTSH